MKDGSGRDANRLAGETSPYLLQHRFNPVDWYPWGPEALARARDEDRPLFVSIGYAACHWCHVMERESFEDEGIARRINERFVPVKVDREERPDLDDLYMSAVQFLTGQGGWPLNVFLTPDLRPFYGGTYFPPRDVAGRPGFPAVLDALADAWRDRRDDVERSAAELHARIRGLAQPFVGRSAAVDVARASARAAAELAGRFDAARGGFSPAPKFPPDQALALLLREHARTGESVPLEMARTTLDRMARGGIHDHVGGGFARYSVDADWLVPHFEKMLYNQALLVPVYADAWLVTGDAFFRRTAERALDFVRRRLTGPDGGFLSSLDADSEGEEGRYYVWTPEEIDAALAPLGADAARAFREAYGIRPEGHFEGRNIPNLLHAAPAEQARAAGVDVDAWDAAFAPARRALLEARRRRVPPATDDKVLTAWNGLAITAFCRAWQAFGRPEDLESARRAAAFVEGALRDGDRLRASWREGRARFNGYLDDHAFLLRALVDLYESDFDPRHLDAARGLARTLVERFADPAHGGFFFVSDDHEELPARNRSLFDGALPAGAGVAAEGLLRLSLLDGESPGSPGPGRAAAEAAIAAAAGAIERAPSALAATLAAAEYLDGGVQIALVGAPDDPATRALLAEVRAACLPARVVALRDPARGEPPLPWLEGKELPDGRPAAWVCRDFACAAPTSDPAVLRRQLRDQLGRDPNPV